MERRTFLAGGGAAFLLPGVSWAASLDQPQVDTALRQAYTRMIAKLPGRRVATTGQQALGDWDRLRAAGDGWPVVVGHDTDLNRIAEQALGYEGDIPRRSISDILAAAEPIRHPDDYIAFGKAQDALARAELAKMPREKRRYTEIIISHDGKRIEREIDPLNEPDREPEVGEWPSEPVASEGLSVAWELVEVDGDFVSRPLKHATILVLPTNDPTEIPAVLNWGGWNACPAPEYHVAALRSWRVRWGAELVGLSADRLCIRVKQRPGDRDSAIRLAREFYAYCPDIVDQGTGTLSVLAASLMSNDWWTFWWD